ncbi:hypothetical protein [Alkaliphilus peptidifermentans]|uniref:Uncharacterized protein n=1 Tax=Alkaliphilus peptidifermentans DSM 18978 TaxID=1120976 RepID=A0A1G5L4N2_9FIRM|nr:hypothetical protein [Alkaliphilus peptidifermentans]SCZ07421.1 hypothetical protein SAMN03080606_04026 [Alkaliphilus peptidifermentans DSM 18978]
MIRKSQFTVIKGGKNTGTEKCFKSALVTRTRLMGVVALKLHWIKKDNQNFLQWFLLDAEEHGIYDYDDMITGSIDNEAEETTHRFMGHLGGEIVSLTEEEAVFLVKHYAAQNKLFNKELPRIEAYKFILDKNLEFIEDKLLTLNNKIYENISTYQELIHYFIMRSVGNDEEGVKYFLSNSTNKINYKPIERAAVLLKNEIRILKNDGVNSTYITKSIVDRNDNYHIIHSQITINEDKLTIVNAEVIKVISVSPEEVAYEIKSPEYIKVYKTLQHTEKFLSSLEHLNKMAIKYEFPQGKMFVEFRSNNEHVKRKNFFIGADILAIYFLNHFNQFIVCYYHEEDFKIIEKNLMTIPTRRTLENLKEYQLKGSIIYEYAEVKKIDFIEYIKKIIEE